MAYVEHTPVKPEKLAAAAVQLLDREVVVPSLFTKKSVDDFKGAADDTLNMKVPGVLPFHEYAWRNDRTSPLVTDEYAERKISVSFGGNFYSAVQLTDEQYEFDFASGWGKLLAAQARAVGRGLEHGAVSTLEGADYEVEISAAARGGISQALVEARRVMNRFNVPGGSRTLLVGSDFDAEMQNEEKFNLALNVGDANANTALKEASIGRWKGFNIVTSNEIAADAAYAFVPSAYVFLNAAPAVPQSVGTGATASFNNVSLRWIRDYNAEYLFDRSVVNTWAGFDVVTDVLRGIGTDGNETVSTAEYFVRGVKLTLDGTEKYPIAGSELANITGVTAPSGS